MLPEINEIRRRRKAAGITQNELARMAGCSKSMIAKLEEGRNEASYRLVKRIFEALEAKATEAGGMQKVAGEIMTSHIIAAAWSDSLNSIAKTMKEKSLSQIPIMGGERCVGSITSRTFSELAAEGRDWKGMKAGGAMGEPFPQVPASTPSRAVAELLKSVQAVLIVEKGKITGIVTKDDFL